MSSSFRPIAPAEDVYAASCNPPRRAKRRRSDSSSPSQPDDDDDDAAPVSKRRGRRPGTLSRAAREAQRKINHSLIEKARRTKINDALATLRDLVPPEYKRPSESHPDDSDDDDDDDPKRPRQKPKAQPEKEFKLEILIRTVAYLQDLSDRVKQLEHDGCPRCSEPISFAAGRRKCPADAQDVDTSRASSVAPHSRLPSISAWLPEDLLLTPFQSPTFDTTVAARSTQLPTPPTSTICAPATTGYQIPPVLTLPSPCTRLPSATTTAHILPRFSGFASRPRPSMPSPASSPTYTPDDETAASLLLRMSTTSSRTASNGVLPSHVSSAGCGALTPSRLLGLSAER
ncbi:hypothetical protein L210DRAFT_846646 [Boletus edulis BED1]|uniref:BHLH domain-containing protein n=1 Tax=Boletus edulis BED1 TaxID=1328754 RepID=A0AAD4C8Y8_BOLED|nr:hypothetical protein L210DRAFT_846646 [Boletus edulis BED1]